MAKLTCRSLHSLVLPLLPAVFFIYSSAFSQLQPVENSVFWEITGNGLQKPSYLFGTLHLMGKSYTDSLAHVNEKLAECEVIAGELYYDNSLSPRFMEASMLQGTTLDRLLSPDDLARTADWLREISGYELNNFNDMNPLALRIMLMTMIQRRYYPMDPEIDKPMHIYFQQYGKQTDKEVMGLEDVGDQIYALYVQFSYERQAEILRKFIGNKDAAYTDQLNLNKFYRDGNLAELRKIMSGPFERTEIEIMLDQRNKKWMIKLPSLFRSKSVFVAIGALHLAGENGLVNLLRQQGFIVRPLSLN